MRRGVERHIRAFNAGAALHRAFIGDEFRPAVPVRGWRRLYRAGRLLFHCIAGSVRATNDPSSPIPVLSGAGGGVVDPAFFCSSTCEARGFEAIVYPGWRRYVEIGFSVESLVEHLAAQMAARVPEGPIRVIGMSPAPLSLTPRGSNCRRAGARSAASARLIPTRRARIHMARTKRASPSFHPLKSARPARTPFVASSSMTFALIALRVEMDKSAGDLGVRMEPSDFAVWLAPYRR